MFSCKTTYTAKVYTVFIVILLSHTYVVTSWFCESSKLKINMEHNSFTTFLYLQTIISFLEETNIQIYLKI